MDYFGFKKIFISILILETIVASTVYFIAQYRAVYFVWVCLNFSIQGGIASCMPGILGKNFGPHVGGTLISAVTLIFGSSGLICFFMQSTFIEKIGYLPMFMMLTGCTILGFIVMLSYP